MTIDELMKKQQDVLTSVKHLKKYDEPTEVFEWEQEIYALKDGVYRPVGRLKLPFKAEDVTEAKMDEPLILYTCFTDEFFETGKTWMKEWEGYFGSHTDFQEKHPNLTIVAYADSPLHGLRELIGDYFDMRKKMQDAKPSRGKELMMGCFAEYEK